MFLKKIVKTDKNTRKTYDYYRLVESYRIGIKTRHRNILTLGKLDELDARQRKVLADRIEELVRSTANLFDYQPDNQIEKHAQYAYKRIIDENLMDVAVPPSSAYETGQAPHYESIDLHSIEHEDAREVGIEWLCLKMLERLGIPGFLAENGLSSIQVKRALSNWIGRLAFPVSELQTVRWLQDNSALPTVLGLDAAKLDHRQLYGAANQLYGLKDELEAHLSQKATELFDLQDKIILYDLTNTYFEGRMQASSKAQFGRSKEKRSDAPIISLALVTDSNGFPKYSHFYKGNISEPDTLFEVIGHLSDKLSARKEKRIVVIDAGIATDDNLIALQEKGYDYLCVSRKKLKDYEAQLTDTVHLADKKGNSIEVKKLHPEGQTDTWLAVKSEQKQLKEQSIDDKLSARYEQYLQQIKDALSKKNGTKKLDKVHQRIGRLKQKYPRINKLFEIEVHPDGDRAADITWKKLPRPANQQTGLYFIRTSLKAQGEAELWNIYNTLREIEATFRVLKTDLSIRPVFHRNDETIEAHLFLGILAYHVVAAIRHQLKAAGIKHCWREVVRIMNTQKWVTTSFITQKGQKRYLSQPTRPTPQVQDIYRILKLEHIKKRKSVVPQNKYKKS
jgi:transposase